MVTQMTLCRPNKRATGVAAIGVLLVLLGFSGRTAPVRAEEAGSTQEVWYVYRIDGKEFGHMQITTRRTATEVRTTEENVIVINRLGAKVEISSQCDFVESADGQARSAKWNRSSPVEKSTVVATVEPGKVVLRVTTGGREYRRELPYSGELLGPSGVDRRIAAGSRKWATW